MEGIQEFSKPLAEGSPQVQVTEVDLDNFDELQNMDTQTSSTEEGLSELGEELSSLEAASSSLAPTEKRELDIFEEPKADKESTESPNTLKQDLAVSYLNHGIAGTSLAFTPAKAKQAASAALIKAGLPCGLVLSLEGEQFSYLTHWNEDSHTTSQEIKKIKLSFEDLPENDGNSLWLNVEPVPKALMPLRDKDKNQLRVHWGSLSANASAVTIASWSGRAFHGRQLEVLSAKLLDQLTRKVK